MNFKKKIFVVIFLFGAFVAVGGTEGDIRTQAYQTICAEEKDVPRIYSIRDVFVDEERI